MWRRLLMVLAAAGAGAAGMTLWRLAREAEGGAGKAGRGPGAGGARARVAGTPRPEGGPAARGSTEARVSDREPPGEGVAAAAGARRCAGITQGGTRCTRDAEEGSDYCWQHGA